MMQKCSYCGKESRPELIKCGECGLPLEGDETDGAAGQDSNPRRTHGLKVMTRGIIWFVGGLIVTLFSYLSAVRSPYGGHYFIAFGAMLGGLAQFFRGRAAANGTDASDQAEELLNIAARFESVDRNKALALYAEVVRRFPGTRESNEARRNMQMLASHG
jgi:hypothetical protein